MMGISRAVTNTDNNFKRVSSVSLLRHWPEYPSYYLTGDLDAARRSSVWVSSAVESRIAPVTGDATVSVPETGPGDTSVPDTGPGAASSSAGFGHRTGDGSGFGYRAGEVFIEEEDSGGASGSGAGMTEAQISAENQEEYVEYLAYLSKNRVPGT